MWQPRCVVWLLLSLSACSLYGALSEGQVIGAELGSGPVSVGLFWFLVACFAFCIAAMTCYCRVIPVTVHLSGDRLSVALLHPFGRRTRTFAGDELTAVCELSTSIEYGYTPTMYRLVLRSRWLPILLDERAEVLNLQPLRALLR